MDEELRFCGCGAGSPLVAHAVRAWGKRSLSYAVAGSLPGLPAEDFRKCIADAFASWAAVTGLAFREALSGAVDIVLTTGRIDGGGGVLAWSELPDGSDRQLTQRYDTSDRYVVAERPGRNQIDLLAVATHEIGHALGLEHAPDGSPDLMAPVYQPGRRTPQPGDVARIQAVYGKVTPPPPPPAGEPVVIRVYGATKIEIPGYKVTPA